MGKPRGAASLRQVSDGLSFLASPGELGGLIAQKDWSATPLGPLERWPQSLRTAISLMLNSRHPMWIGWGPQASFLYNDAYVEMLGEAKHPWALGRPADEVWAEVWDFCGPLADKVLLHGEATYVDDVQLFINRGGFLEEAWYSFSYSPITDEGGQVGGLFCPTTDVTSTNLTARRLATVSRLAASALGEATVAGACATAVAALAANPADIPFVLLYLADADGGHAMLQAAAGVAPCTALAPSQVSLGGEETGVPLPVAEVLRTGQARCAAVAGLPGLPCGLARQPLAQAMLLPLTLAGRAQPVGVLVAGVSAVRRLDPDYLGFFELVASQVAAAVQKAAGAEEQERRAATLADLDRAKDEFLAMLGHELRNPLSPILIALDLLRLKNVRGAEKEHAIIERQAQHLVRLVDDLLDVARIARGKIELRPERAELSRLVAQAVETTSPLFEERCHRLHLDVPNTGIFVMADPMRFTQVLSNLLTNAAKYTNPCGRIDLCVRTEAGQAVVEVADNGIGIAPETLPHLFDKFVQERQALDRSRGGLGLGLAIVKSIVLLHGGTVSAHSAGAGQGSRFVVRVPTCPEGVEALPPERVAPQIAAAHPCTVLLVDDNPDVLQAMAALLELSGHRVATLADPAAALRLPAEFAPEVAILDIGLPGMDGYELALELGKRPAFAETRLIALSGYGQPADRARSKSAGFCAHLVKPISGNQLAALIDSLFQPG